MPNLNYTGLHSACSRRFPLQLSSGSLPPPDLVAQVRQSIRTLAQADRKQNADCVQYGGDLWVVDRGDGEAKRLTSDLGIEFDPLFSPGWHNRSPLRANTTAMKTFMLFLPAVLFQSA